MSMRFFLSDLPEFNLIANGDMNRNSDWQAFGHGSVKCWQSANLVNHGLSWYVNKPGAAAGASAGVRSGNFALELGQTYRLSLWIHLADGTTTVPKVCVFAKSGTQIVANNEYTPGYAGWQQFSLTFLSMLTTSEAFLVVVYDGNLLGSFYLDNVMLYKAASKISQLEIRPHWNMNLGYNAGTTKTRSQAGRLFIYDWHRYAKQSITLDFVPEADAALINGFWQNRTRLLYTASNHDQLTSYITGVITNDATPLNQYQAPYSNYFRGKITFEEL